MNIIKLTGQEKFSDIKNMHRSIRYKLQILYKFHNANELGFIY